MSHEMHAFLYQKNEQQIQKKRDERSSYDIVELRKNNRGSGRSKRHGAGETTVVIKT